MRILGMGSGVDLGDLYFKLVQAGHEVRVHAQDPEAFDTFAGLVEKREDWEREKDWIFEAQENGIFVFETSSQGVLQDQLRKEGFFVVGGSAFGDRLETDRAFGQQVLRDIGLRTAGIYEFDDFDKAIRFVQDTRCRYVFKLNGMGFASNRNYVGQLADGLDVISWLMMQRDHWHFDESPSFILMEHITGVETGVGAYFNGEDFLMPACLDWEHKRFFNQNLGELTGEMGTLVTYQGAEKLFEASLGKMRSLLARSGYCGYINLNMMINQEGIWPLEFTCRFGYPGFAILSALQIDGWEDLLACMTQRKRLTFRTHPGFAVGVVLTVPPFPYAQGYETLSKGMPILFCEALTPQEQQHLHYGEVALKNKQLVTSGQVGYIMVVTGHGNTVQEAQKQAYQLAKKVVIPNVRYRTDIGDEFLKQDRKRLIDFGWLPKSFA